MYSVKGPVAPKIPTPISAPTTKYSSITLSSGRSVVSGHFPTQHVGKLCPACVNPLWVHNTTPSKSVNAVIPDNFDCVAPCAHFPPNQSRGGM